MNLGDKLRAEIREHESALKELRAMLQEHLGADAGPAIVKLEQFLAEPVTFNWMLGGLIAEDTIGIMAAEPGMGKTTLATQIALSLAAGRTVLDHPVSQEYPALVIAAEGSRAAFRLRVDRARKALNIPQEATRWFVHAADYSDITFGTPGFERLIAESGARFVVCDTLGYFIPGADENSAVEWKASVMVPLRHLAEKYHATFCIIHHLTKPSEFRKGIHRLRGSSAMVADSDFVFLLDAVEGDTTGEKRTLTVAKNKYASSGTDIELRYAPVDAVFHRDDIPATEPAVIVKTYPQLEVFMEEEL